MNHQSLPSMELTSFNPPLIEAICAFICLKLFQFASVIGLLHYINSFWEAENALLERRNQDHNHLKSSKAVFLGLYFFSFFSILYLLEIQLFLGKTQKFIVTNNTLKDITVKSFSCSDLKTYDFSFFQRTGAKKTKIPFSELGNNVYLPKGKTVEIPSLPCPEELNFEINFNDNDHCFPRFYYKRTKYIECIENTENANLVDQRPEF